MAVPKTLTERMKLRRDLKVFVQQKALCPPVSLNLLRALADEYAELNGLPTELTSWLMVEINNQLWIDIVAAIPYERRILLAPSLHFKTMPTDSVRSA